MAECNGCGDCCDVIPLNATREELAADSPEMARWAAHLHPLTRRQVMDRGQGWRLVKPMRMFTGEVELFPRFWTCDLLDPVTRRCTDYDNRPQPCRGYPWYDGQVRRDAQLSPRCSYRADIGQPVELGPTR